MAKALSLILATIDRPEQLTCALTSYTHWDRNLFDMWVMDDSGANRIIAACEPFRDRLDMHLVKFTGKTPNYWRGPEMAYARGLSMAMGDAICITQEGVLVPADMLEPFLVYLEKHEIVNVFTIREHPPDPRDIIKKAEIPIPTAPKVQLTYIGPAETYKRADRMGNERTFKGLGSTYLMGMEDAQDFIASGKFIVHNIKEVQPPDPRGTCARIYGVDRLEVCNVPKQEIVVKMFMERSVLTKELFQWHSIPNKFYDWCTFYTARRETWQKLNWFPFNEDYGYGHTDAVLMNRRKKQGLTRFVPPDLMVFDLEIHDRDDMKPVQMNRTKSSPAFDVLY